MSVVQIDTASRQVSSVGYYRTGNFRLRIFSSLSDKDLLFGFQFSFFTSLICVHGSTFVLLFECAHTRAWLVLSWIHMECVHVVQTVSTTPAYRSSSGIYSFQVFG